MRTCENSHFGNNYEGELTRDQFYDGKIVGEDPEDDGVLGSPCYESAITQQQHIFSQL